MQTSARLPRFEQQPDAIPGFELQLRDIEILLTIARLRFATSAAVIALLQAKYRGTSEQKIKRRLQLLYHSDYLDRPLRQLDPYVMGQGTRPFVYMIGRRGLDLLSEKYNFRRSSADWTKKARTATRGTLDHALEVSDFLVGIMLACERSKRYEMIYFDQIMRELAPPETRKNPRPYHWPVKVKWRNEEEIIYVIPDKLFGIKDNTRPEGKNKKYFMLEADRGTQAVWRRTLRQSSLLRKLIGYGATYKDDLHQKIYGLSNFRMLLVTSGRKRIKTVIDVHRKYTQAHLSPRLERICVALNQEC